MHGIAHPFSGAQAIQRVMISVAMLGGAISASSALAQDPCAQWIAKKGYAHDFVEYRTGFKPPALDKWTTNVHRDDLDVDDAVLLKSTPGHIALIDEVERDAAGKITALKVSEYNYRAKSSEAWQDERCKVSNNFGKATSRKVSISDVSGQWRAPKSRRY